MPQVNDKMMAAISFCHSGRAYQKYVQKNSKFGLESVIEFAKLIIKKKSDSQLLPQNASNVEVEVTF